MKTTWFFLFGLVGCAATPTVRSGAFVLKKSDAEESFAQVRSRAEFELRCPAEKLELSVLAVYPQYDHADLPKQIGVTGCDHRMVYVRAPGDSWILNTDEKKAER